MGKGRIVIAVLSVIVLAVSGVSLYTSVRALSGGAGTEQAVKPSREPGSALQDTLPAVRVAVLNGCGRPGIASEFVDKLRSDGMDVVNGMGGNADSFEFDRSVVVDRRGDRRKAERISAFLGIREILDQRSENPYILEDVVVIIGRDWDTLLFSGKEKSD